MKKTYTICIIAVSLVIMFTALSAVDVVVGIGKSARTGVSFYNITDIYSDDNSIADVSEVLDEDNSPACFVVITGVSAGECSVYFTGTVTPYSAPHSFIIAVSVFNPFTPVTSVTLSPLTIPVNTPTPLTVTISPASATNLNTTLSVVNTDAGATLTGNILTATKAGKTTIRATVQHGIRFAEHYTQDFIVESVAAVTPTPNPSPNPTSTTTPTVNNNVTFNLSDMRIVKQGAGHLVKEIKKLNDGLPSGAIYTSGNVLVINFNRIDEPVKVQGVHWEWLLNDGIDTVRLVKGDAVKELSVKELMSGGIAELSLGVD